MLHARSNLFESAGMSLPPWRVDSMDRQHVSPSHLRTVAARTQSVLRDKIFCSEGDTMGVRFFTAFCNHWNCTSLQPLHLRWFSHCFATIDNFCLVFLQWLNKTKTQKNKKPKKNDKTQLSATTPPLGCAILFFCFCFCFLCFFFFLVLAVQIKKKGFYIYV